MSIFDSFNINSCGFEANNYDIYGAIVHVNIENCYFSKSGKKKGDLFIYAPFAIGYTIIQGNTFDLPVYGKPHIVKSSTYYWGNDSLTVYTWDPAHGQKDYAVEIRCARNNGMATPAGVMVGMPENILNQAYGK